MDASLRRFSPLVTSCTHFLQWFVPPTVEMANTTEKGYDSGTDSLDNVSQEVRFERPTGLKGLYYHPMTQVRLIDFRKSELDLRSVRS